MKHKWTRTPNERKSKDLTCSRCGLRVTSSKKQADRDFGVCTPPTGIDAIYPSARDLV